MKKLLVVVDMQKDFVVGPLGTEEARLIVPKVVTKVEEYIKNGWEVIFTRDTHKEDYLKTQEGKFLPIEHCKQGTEGHDIVDELGLLRYGSVPPHFLDKRTFGSIELAKKVEKLVDKDTEVELVGVCTDICVLTNALILKTYLDENLITVDSKCCAGVTPEKHKAALEVLRSCQVNVI